MKGLNITRGAIVAAILFSSHVAFADLDPVVIKVCAMSYIPSVEREAEETPELTFLFTGLQVLLQVQWNTVVSSTHRFDLCSDTHDQN